MPGAETIVYIKRPGHRERAPGGDFLKLDRTLTVYAAQQAERGNRFFHMRMTAQARCPPRWRGPFPGEPERTR
jgi:hypothetical protein